jgi:hypothetical protein
VPIAAAPAARAAFLATRLTFGSRVFFVFASVLAFVVFLVFDLVRARFEADLAFVRLTLFFMIPSLGSNRWRSTLNGVPELQCPSRAEVPFERLRVTRVRESKQRAGPTSSTYASGPPARRWMLCADWPGTRDAIRTFRFVRLAGKRCDILCELGSVWGPPLPAIVPPLAMPLRHDIAAVTANGRVVVSLAAQSNCHFIECPAMRALKFEETWCSWRHGQNQKLARPRAVTGCCG